MEWDFGLVRRGNGEASGKRKEISRWKGRETSTWAHLNGSPSEGPQVPGLTTMENQQSFVLLYNGTLEEPNHRAASSTFLYVKRIHCACARNLYVTCICILKNL